jgi:hypothetical protein
VFEVEVANPALQPSINPAGKDAPDPIRSTALAGVARTNESDRTATAAFTKRAFIIYCSLFLVGLIKTIG